MNTTGLTALNASMNTNKGKDAIAPSAAAPDAGGAMTPGCVITAEGMDGPEPDAVIWALRCYAATLALHFYPGHTAWVREIEHEYIAERNAFEELKRLCVDVESFASHHACNARSVSPHADKVYAACCGMRRIIYPANQR